MPPEPSSRLRRLGDKTCSRGVCRRHMTSFFLVVCPPPVASWTRLRCGTCVSRKGYPGLHEATYTTLCPNRTRAKERIRTSFKVSKCSFSAVLLMRE